MWYLRESGEQKKKKKYRSTDAEKKTLIIMINKYKRTRLYFSFTSPVINVGRHRYAFLFVFRPPQRNGRGQHDGHEPVWVVATGTTTVYDTRRSATNAHNFPELYRHVSNTYGQTDGRTDGQRWQLRLWRNPSPTLPAGLMLKF